MMFLFIFLGLVLLSSIVQAILQKRLKKYSKVRISIEYTGAQIARKMLNDHGIYDVKVVSISGTLTDHYNPATKTVNLSHDVYSNSSVTAAAVAAHECGHAVQHATGYAPLRMRSSLVPAVNLANKIVNWVLLAGVLGVEIFPPLLYFGIALFTVTVFFSFVTLPVEINASIRAIAWLEKAGVSDEKTRPMAIDALKWAAYTYVIAALTSLATLAYYIMLAMSIAARRR